MNRYITEFNSVKRVISIDSKKLTPSKELLQLILGFNSVKGVKVIPVHVTGFIELGLHLKNYLKIFIEYHNVVIIGHL